MKGFLDKRENGWFLSYVALSDSEVGTVIKELPLLPDDIAELDELESRIFENPRVDFVIVEECSNYSGEHFGRDCSCREGFVQYAKLIKINKL